MLSPNRLLNQILAVLWHAGEYLYMVCLYCSENQSAVIR